MAIVNGGLESLRSRVITLSLITPAGSVVSIIVSARQIPKVRCVLVANPRVTAVWKRR